MTPELERFTAATIEALYFTDTGDEGQPSPEAKMDPETLADLRADCRSFWRRYGCFVTGDICVDHWGDRWRAIERAGHDFWLTRNGHGAGFWDGDWPETYAEMFTQGAKCYGPFETYETDNGEIAA